MSFTEHGRKTLSCGTIVYSYKNCIGGYLITVKNIDTDKYSGTAGVDVSKEYLLEIMDRLMENNITPESSSTFIFDKVHHYFELHPRKAQKAYSPYLYL